MPAWWTVRGDIEPALAIGLVVADLLANAWSEDLGSTTRARVETGIAKPGYRVLEAEARRLGEKVELDHGEGLEVDPGETLFESPKELLVVVDQQLRVETGDDVQFGDRFVDVASGDLHRLLDRVGPAVLALPPRNIEGAQLARRHAHVGGVEVTVDVVVGPIAVQAFPNQIGHAPDSEKIVRWWPAGDPPRGPGVRRRALFRPPARGLDR